MALKSKVSYRRISSSGRVVPRNVIEKGGATVRKEAIAKVEGRGSVALQPKESFGSYQARVEQQRKKVGVKSLSSSMTKTKTISTPFRSALNSPQIQTKRVAPSSIKKPGYGFIKPVENIHRIKAVKKYDRTKFVGLVRGKIDSLIQRQKIDVQPFIKPKGSKAQGKLVYSEKYISKGGKRITPIRKTFTMHIDPALKGFEKKRVMAHEFGHYLDFTTRKTTAPYTKAIKVKEVQGHLKRYKPKQKSKEAYAEGFEKFYTSPFKFSAKYPKLTSHYLKGYNKLLKRRGI